MTEAQTMPEPRHLPRAARRKRAASAGPKTGAAGRRSQARPDGKASPSAGKVARDTGPRKKKGRAASSAGQGSGRAATRAGKTSRRAAAPAGKTSARATTRAGKTSARSNGRAGAARSNGRKPAPVPDLHALYEAAVQSPEEDVRFMERVFRSLRGRPMRSLREDFCGTATTAAAFVRRHPQNRAWAVDIDGPTLEWGRKHHVEPLGKDAARIKLLCSDVLDVRTPKVDVVSSLNFSHWLLADRGKMLRYFRRVRRTLAPDGVFFTDAFGGTEAMGTQEDERRIAGERDPAGNRIPTFKYVWDQARFNVVDHAFRCHIHFELADGTRLEKAFSYDWRLWTLPELRDIMHEAGFPRTEVYMEGWDDDADEPDGIFRKRLFMENQLGWVGYLIGLM